MSSKKSTLYHFFSIGIGTVVNMLLGLVSTPVITRLVSPEEYGQVSIFLMYANIALFILCMGLDQSFVRFYYNEENLNYKRSLLKTCMVFTTCFSIVVSIVLIGTSILIPDLFEFDTKTMILLCVYIIILIWNRMSMLALRTAYLSVKYATCNIVNRLIFISLSILLIKGINKDFFILLVITHIMSMLGSTIAAIAVNKELWNFKKIRVLDNKKEILKFGLPFILSMGITTLFQACDKIALDYYCTYNEVGIYTSALSLAGIFAIIQTTFNTLWSPLQIEHYVNNPEDRSFIQKGNRYIIVIMFGFGLSLILIKDLLVYLLGPEYRSAAYILPFLIFDPIMYTISETTVGGIDFTKKSYFHIVVASVACLTNILGNFYLVPLLGCKGAAISTGLSYIVFFAARTFISKHLYPINLKLWKFWIVTFFAILYAYFNTFQTFSINSILLYLVGMAIILVLYYETIKEMLSYGISLIEKFISKKNNHVNE